MCDPRIDEFVERIGEVDSKGNPTRVPDMARRVKDYLVGIDKLRSEVDIATRQVVYLAGREQAMVKNTQQFMATRISSVQQILDTYLNSTPTELNASAVAVEGTTIKRKKKSFDEEESDDGARLPARIALHSTRRLCPETACPDPVEGSPQLQHEPAPRSPT